MGRRKIKKTRKQILEQRKRYREQHNSSRREKYANDAKYREVVHRRNRERYRRENSVKVRKVATPAEVSKAAVISQVDDGGTMRRLKCVDYETMALLVGGYHKFVLHRWHRSGRFPRACHEALSDGHRKSVYLLDEAKQLVDIMREHQQEKLYFTDRDKKTIERLFKVMG